MNLFRLLSLSIAALILAACKNGPDIYPEFVGNEPVVRVDTLEITDFVTAQNKLASGALNLGSSFVGVRYVLAGGYNDPLFGDTEATALIRPGLFRDTSVDTFNTGSRYYLRLIASDILGDTTSTQQFSIRQINRLWRGNSWMPDSNVAPLLGTELTTFNYVKEDTFLVELPAAWGQIYKDVAYSAKSDSLYDARMFGFAIVPIGSSKLVTFEGSSATIQVHHTKKVSGTTRDTTVTYSTFCRSWASSRTSNSTLAPAGKMILDNTFSNMISMDIEATFEKFGTSNVMRAELVLFEDTLSLKNSLPAGHLRPKSSQLEVYVIRPVDLNYDLSAYSPYNRAVFTRADGSFRISLTDILNDQLRKKTQDIFRFYLSYKGSSSGKGADGSLYRTLLYSTASADRKPYLIISYVEPDA